MRRLFLILALLLPSILNAQSTAPLEGALDPQGRLRPGGSGSFDGRGWRMSLDDDGSPRFHPDGKDDPSLQSAGPWNTSFGETALDGGVVYSIALDGSKVYVGGLFRRAGEATVSNVAMWDRTTETWSDLGGGFSYTVHALAIHDGDLIAAGRFTYAGDSLVMHVARWDGSTWHPMGDGLLGSVYSLVVADGQLIAGGDDGMWLWSGATWESIGTVDGWVETFAYENGILYAGGWFTNVGGVAAQAVAKWDGGNWSALGAGLSSTVYTLSVHQGAVIAGGDFVYSGDRATRLNFIGWWDGSKWNAYGDGATSAVTRTLSTPDGLYVAGAFAGIDRVFSEGIIKWDGTAWAPITWLQGIGRALAYDESGLYIGGEFNGADTLFADNIIRRVGSEWQALGEGVSDGAYATSVYAMARDGNDIYVGGRFTWAGNEYSNFIACWDGDEGRWRSLGNGVNAPVQGLAIRNGILYAAGEFTRAGNQIAWHAAQWDIAREEWSSVGNGLFYSTFEVTAHGDDIYIGGWCMYKWNGSDLSFEDKGPIGWIYALESSGSDLYAGGSIDATVDTPGDNLVRWDGSSWSTLGGGVDRSVYAIETHGSSVYAGGSFMTAGGTRAERIAQWDGSKWHDIGGADNTVMTLEFARDALYAGGWFSSAGTTSARYLARWDGSEWSAFDEQPNYVVRSLLETPTSLYVGGIFAYIGSESALGFAEWQLGPAAVRSTSSPSTNMSLLTGADGSSTLKLTLDRPGHLVVTLHDLLGREVSRLADEQVEPGDHTLPIGDNALAAGTYICRIAHDGNVSSMTITVW